MAKRTRVKINRAALRELMRDASLVEGRAAAIAAACNEESTWGGYFSGVTVTPIRARATVWSLSSAGENRNNRMLRHLGDGG